MSTDRLVALKAFVHLRDILANTSLDLIRSLGEAREVRLALDHIFENQVEDNGPSKFLRTIQSSSEGFQSTRNDGETISSLTLSSSTRNRQKRPCTGFDHFNPPKLISSSIGSCPPLKRIQPSVPLTSARLVPPSQVLSPPSLPFNIYDLIDNLTASSERITQALTDQKFTAAVTTRAEWTIEDPRVVDIKMSDNSPTDKARRTFAERGLAKEYQRWRIQHHRGDIIEELMQNPKVRVKQGTVRDFIQTHSPPFQDIRTVREGLNHGIKMLLLERSFQEPTISAILNFSHKRFTKVGRDELYILCKVAQSTEWMMALVGKLPGWVESCQAKYDAWTEWLLKVKTHGQSNSSEENQSGFTGDDLSDIATAATEGTYETCHDNPDRAADLPFQHTLQTSHGTTQNSIVEHGSEPGGSAPRREDSRRHEEPPDEGECEIDSIPYNSSWPDLAFLPNRWTNVDPTQGEINAQQEGIYESYHQTYSEEPWSTPWIGVHDRDRGLPGPEFDAHNDAHASAFAPPFEYLSSIS